jgi:integrase
LTSPPQHTYRSKQAQTRIIDGKTCSETKSQGFTPKTVQRELPYFTVAQMASIAKAAKTQMNRALFALAAGTGARAGELFA